MRITTVLSVPVLVLGFPFPVPDFNNIHLVLTQIQTVICVSVSLQMCDNILFHYLCVNLNEPMFNSSNTRGGDLPERDVEFFNYSTHNEFFCRVYIEMTKTFVPYILYIFLFAFQVIS